MCEVLLAQPYAADVAARLKEFPQDVLCCVFRQTPNEDGATTWRTFPGRSRSIWSNTKVTQRSGTDTGGGGGATGYDPYMSERNARLFSYQIIPKWWSPLLPDLVLLVPCAYHSVISSSFLTNSLQGGVHVTLSLLLFLLF